MEAYACILDMCTLVSQITFDLVHTISSVFTTFYPDYLRNFVHFSIHIENHPDFVRIPGIEATLTIGFKKQALI